MRPNQKIQANLRAPKASECAFTLIEMIGVLAIIMILALAIVPSLVKTMDQAAKTNEAASLQAIAGGLQSVIANTRWIPSSNNFYQALATNLGWVVSDIEKNARGRPRVIVVDPRLQIGPGNANLISSDYSQSKLGTSAVSNSYWRIMIISSMGSDLTNAIRSPSAENFDLLWNAADGTTPTGWTYGGNFSDIIIQRVSLFPLFARLILCDNSAMNGYYSIDAANSSDYTPLTNTVDAYYIVGSVLGLYDNSGRLQAKQLIKDPASFVFAYGSWSGSLFVPASVGQGFQNTDLQAAYDLFLGSTTNTAKASAVAANMLSYMSNYIYWTTNSPWVKTTNPYRNLTNAQIAMYQSLTNFVYSTTH